MFSYTKNIIRYTLRFVLLVGLVLVNSCEADEDFEMAISNDEERIRRYLAENNIDARVDDSGIFYEALNLNAAGKEIQYNDLVYFTYHMSLLNGNHVASYTDTTNPLVFGYISSGIIPVGIFHGVGLMKTGEEYRFYIPSYLAYEDYGHEGFFPPGAIFIVDVKVIKKVTPEQRRTIETSEILLHLAQDYRNTVSVTIYPDNLFVANNKGGKGDSPGEGDVVKIHYNSKYLNDTLIHSTYNSEPITFTIGNNEVIPGLEEGVKKMKEGGSALIIVPSHLGYGASIQILPRKIKDDLLEKGLTNSTIAPYSILAFEVELLEIND
jgi:FKBP-type peptidyl-prolyl cis-trans isomerase